jgi:hypothetical protein
MVQRIQEDCDVCSCYNADMSIIKYTQDAGT